MLKMLHSRHAGIGSTKSLARNYVWWPKMDKDIEDLVRHCTSCQINQRKPAKATPHPWKNHPDRGNVCIWTMQDRFLTICIWWLSIPILNG